MQHISLLDLNKLITKALAENLEPGYWVVAEISEIRLNQNGHCYIEVVEKKGDTIVAKTRATIWAYTYRNLVTWFESKTGETLKPGLKILFNAVVQYHEVYGLSLNIRDIDANFTLGERARRKAEILERLKQDGIFDMNKDLTLPIAPQRVAVVSSPTAAGFGDFMDHIDQNIYGYKFHVQLYAAVMQGNESAESIINALHTIFRNINHYDLVVIIRGGGASADLDCYDNYELASHVAQYPIPVVTGIGHERDETVIDLVAHTQMKTPTAVAEFLISGMRNFEENLLFSFQRIVGASEKTLGQHSVKLERSARKLCALFKDICKEKERKLDKIFQSLKHYSKQDHEKNRLKLNDLSAKLLLLPQKTLKNEMLKLEAKEKFLEAINPENILKRGYSVTLINGSGLKGYTRKIKAGDSLTTRTAKFEIESVVNQVKNK